MNRWTEHDLAQKLADNPQLKLSSQNSAIAAPVRSQKPGSHQSRRAAETPAEPQAGLNGGGKKRKYRNEPVMVDGVRFDSKKEAARWQDLLLLEKAGEIHKLERQVKFELRVRSVLICKYYADFVYYSQGKKIIEDCKGVRTKEYKLKRKLMEAIYEITILET